jgi:hypothetical protein
LIVKNSKRKLEKNIVMIYDKEQIRLFDWIENKNSSLTLINLLDEDSIDSRRSSFFKLSKEFESDGFELSGCILVVIFNLNLE